MMANARMIRRNFFNDPIISDRYNEAQRYLIIGLACAADDYGRFWWNGKNLKSIIYPLDSRQTKWIEKNLELFFEDEFVCKYVVKNITYGHFPLWFDKSFPLKQRLDHPKPDMHPDCEYHKMNEKNTRKSRETSPANKTKQNKIKQKEYNTKDVPVSSLAPIREGQEETDPEWVKQLMKETTNMLSVNKYKR